MAATLGKMFGFLAARMHEPHPVTFVLGGVIICGGVAFAVASAAGAAVVFGGRTRRSPGRVRLSPTVLVWAAAGAYFAFFSAVTVARHRAMATNAFDLGYFANVIYNFGRGHPFRQTLVGATNGFSDACVPILALFAPLSYVFAEPTYLLVLQSSFLASGVVLVYALARPAVGSRWPAAALSLSFALSPALHGANLCEFHPRALAVPLVLGALYFFSRKHFWPGVACAALLALCREDLALHAVALAAYGGFAAGHKRAGLAAAALLALYYLGVCSYLYPRLTYAVAGGAPYFKSFFAGGAYLQRQTLMGPLIIPAKLAYIGTLVLAAAAFLPAAGGALVTLVTPLAVPALATKGRVFFGIWWHYPLTILPFVYGAAALGVRRLVRPEMTPRRLFLVAGGSVAAVVFHLLLIAYFGGRYYLPTLAAAVRGSYEKNLAAAAARVPANAPICVDDRFAAHLAFRRYIYLYGSLPPAGPRPTPAAMLLERRLYRPTDLPTILSRAARWNLRPAEISEDYVYFTEEGARFSGEDLLATWFDNIEEWECLRPTKLFTRRGTPVADARAHDGRAIRSGGTLRYRPLKGDVYPPGDYVLTFYLRGEDRQRVAVGVTLNAAAGFAAEQVYRVEGEVNPSAYAPLELRVRSECPFRLAFDISSPSPFYFDAAAVASDAFTLAALSKIAPPAN